MTESFKYQGDELELFQHAKNWKKYFSRQIKPFIKGNVLEVGAGIGATTLLLNDGKNFRLTPNFKPEQLIILLKLLIPLSI